MISIQGILFDENSSFQQGTALAPPLIRKALHSDSGNSFTENLTNIKSDLIQDLGDFEIEDYFEIENITRNNLGQSEKLLTLGGDHSITFPIIKAYQEKYPKIDILQIDAHSDLYEDFEGSKYSHACPFARIMEAGLVDNLVQVGVRTLTPHQREQADRFEVEIHEMQNLDISIIRGFKNPLYISLDLDGIDPAFAPGVSHHEPGGLTSREVINIIQNIDTKVVGADIVEYNPHRDFQQMTSYLAAKLMKRNLEQIVGMTYTLRNKDLEIKIDHPLSNYQASRFDWTGKISEVKYLGIPLTITEKPNGEDENLFGKGLYNEFGIDTALGFDDTEVGDWFHKIGVGLLKKEGNEYKFSHPYEVKPAQFEVVAEVDQIKIRCISDIYNGFGYELNKSIILRENRLMLQYELKNLGKKEITSDEYSHNFIAINRSHLNGSYKLNMPFNIKPDEFLFTVEPEDVIRYNNSSISFESNLKEQFLLSHIGGSNAKTATWEMIHQDEKIGLREEGSFPTEKINIWGWGHVISPELFHQIKLSPGETERWFRTYHFFQVN